MDVTTDDNDAFNSCSLSNKMAKKVFDTDVVSYWEDSEEEQIQPTETYPIDQNSFFQIRDNWPLPLQLWLDCNLILQFKKNCMNIRQFAFALNIHNQVFLNK